MALPGWESLDSVKHFASVIEVTTLVFWSLLVVFEIGARFWKKYSNLLGGLALIAFALAVLGEVAEHKYSARKDVLDDARQQGLISDYNHRLKAANEVVNKAQADAAQPEQSSLFAQQQASAASKEAEKLKEQQGYRELTETQKAQLIALLKPYAPQTLYFICAPDSETTTFADEIASALDAAGWKTKGPPYNWGTITHYTAGVQIQVADVTKPVSQGASVLQAALIKVGVHTDASNFPMVGPNGFLLYVGLRPKPTP
jgi:hypothetical protein